MGIPPDVGRWIATLSVICCAMATWIFCSVTSRSSPDLIAVEVGLSTVFMSIIWTRRERTPVVNHAVGALGALMAAFFLSIEGQGHFFYVIAMLSVLDVLYKAFGT
jgi:hypothetical protein